jgi:hypothetical protein
VDTEIKKQELPIQPAAFTPSPVKRIQFSDGKVLSLNRCQRRKAHIYNRDLKPVKKGKER